MELLGRTSVNVKFYISLSVNQNNFWVAFLAMNIVRMDSEVVGKEEEIVCEHFFFIFQYYSQHGLDFRSLRFPGVIGADTEPGGGTTGTTLCACAICMHSCKNYFNTLIKILNQNCYLTGLLFFTDYAVHIFHEVAKEGKYSCFLKKDTRLPMIYIDDCLRAVCEFMEFPSESLSQRTYNVTAMSFTPDELVEEMRNYYPKMRVDYEPDEKRQEIGKQ